MDAFGKYSTYMIVFFSALLSFSAAAQAPINHVSENYVGGVNFKPHSYMEGSRNTVNVTLINAVELSMMFVTQIKTLTDWVAGRDYKGFYDHIKTLLWENKYKIGAYAVGSLYMTLATYLFFEYHMYIHNKNLWSYWRSERSFEQLCEIPQCELGKELILAIQAHDIDPKNPISFTKPLITFIYSIDGEIKRIERYLIIARTLQRMKLDVIFPINATKIQYAQILLDRAQFIRHIFMSWLAEYNFETKN